MLKQGTEKITYRLSISMLVIILSLFAISIPLVISSYQDYIKTKNALIEIEVLNTVADLANKISRERGPANKAMSSHAEDLAKNRQALLEYRNGVDQQVKLTISALQHAGFNTLAIGVQQDVVKRLVQGRQHVNLYQNTQYTKKKKKKKDQAISHMYNT